MAYRILFLETPDIPKTPVGEEQGSGGGAVTSVNGKTGAVTLGASDVGALPDTTPIPSAVTEQTVAGWGFTKNNGTYVKPVGGIPDSDIASAATWNAKGTYSKPSGGIPDSDIASAATWNAKGTYSKPNGGIPKSDLASDVQASLGKADSALQQHQDISGKVDKVTGKGLSTNDYTTAEKQKLAGIEAGAQVNVITSISIDGVDQPPSGGNVNISLPDVPTDYVNTVDFEERTGSMRIVLSYSNGVVALEQSGTPLDRLIAAFLNSCNVWFLFPTAYITGIPSNTDMMRFWMTGANLNKSAPTVSLTSEYGGKVYHAVLSPVSEYRMEGQLNVYNIALPSAESNSFGGA